MIVKLLTEHHLEFLSLKRDCRGSSESTHLKMPQCWKSHALAPMIWCIILSMTIIIMCNIARIESVLSHAKSCCIVLHGITRRSIMPECLA